MNAKFIRLPAILLALVLLLSGCNLIEIDMQMQAEEDIAKLDEAYSTVVATYDGGEITAGEAMSLFNSSYNEMYYMYQYYLGMEMSADQVRDLMEVTLTDMVRFRIAAKHFDENHTLSEEELAQAEADAQAYYDEAYAELYESAVGDNEEDRAAATLVLLKEVGMDQETNLANTILQAKATRMEEILCAEVEAPSEEDLLYTYEQQLISDEEAYSFSDGAFESAMLEDEPNVCWIPDGYRTVKHILVTPDEDLMNTYMDAVYALEDQEYVLEDLRFELDSLLDNDAETTDEADLLRTEDDIRADIENAEAFLPQLQADLQAAEQACLDSMKPVTDEIYARLAAGEDFEALMAEYGEDPGMQSEPLSSRGYYVGAASANWEQNFINGAMALESIGDYSAEPVLSGSGVHIIYYASDVTGGPVPYEQVRDSLMAISLEEARYNHCETVINEGVEAANPSYDAAAFEKAIFDG